MSVRISLTLEASEMFLSFHMIFSLERAAVVRAILERILDRDDCSKVLEVLRLFEPLTFYLDLSLEAIWVVCHHFRLVWTDPILYLVVAVSRRSSRTPDSSSFSAFTTM